MGFLYIEMLFLLHIRRVPFTDVLSEDGSYFLIRLSLLLIRKLVPLLYYVALVDIVKYGSAPSPVICSLNRSTQNFSPSLLLLNHSFQLFLS
jgi:hypothetical protein